MRVYAAQLNPIVGDFAGNTIKILNAIAGARKEKADIVLFSELVLCGYPPEDLLYYPGFIEEMEKKLHEIAEHTKGLFVAVGLARKNPHGGEKKLYNAAAILIDGKIAGFKDKELLPTYDVFDEMRYFDAGKRGEVYEYKGKKIAITICEDIWQHSKSAVFTDYALDPILDLKKSKPDLLLNLSASPYHFEKRDYRLKVFSPCVKTLKCPFVWCNQVGANDQLVFDGYSLYMDAEGKLCKIAKGFQEDHFVVDIEKKYEPVTFPEDGYVDLYQALTSGVRDYFHKQGFKKALIGLSGGIDSALVACIAVEALGKENVLTVALPSRFSSKASYDDAAHLAKNLGITLEEIPIEGVFQEFLGLLKPHFKGKPFDIAEENLQSRIRGVTLMALSNKFGYIVLSTGNKSEMAMGYATLYGDMSGGLAVIGDLTKMQVYGLCKYINRSKEIIPSAIMTKAPTAELRPNQKDTDSLPEYSVVDAVLEEYVENHRSAEEISKKHHLSIDLVHDLIRKIYSAEYKRRQAPPAIRVSKRAFTKGRQLPIVQKWI
jgi:NAD+ synthase (glutamine-hydrolysing)